MQHSDFSAPKWMTPPEKKQLKKALKARKSLENPLSEAEFLALCDAISARMRVDLLETELRDEIADGVNPQRLLGLHRAIDAASARARKLEKQLDLAG